MPSVPKYQPGQKVTGNYGGERFIGQVVSAEPGSDPVTYKVSLTRIHTSKKKYGNVGGWRDLNGYKEDNFEESELQAVG